MNYRLPKVYDKKGHLLTLGAILTKDGVHTFHCSHLCPFQVNDCGEEELYICPASPYKDKEGNILYYGDIYENGRDNKKVLLLGDDGWSHSGLLQVHTFLTEGGDISEIQKLDRLQVNWKTLQNVSYVSNIFAKRY